MSVPRRAGLVTGLLATGLLVTVSILPAGATTSLPAAGVLAETVSGETEECVAARAEADSYREDIIVPAAEQAAARVVSVEQMIVADTEAAAVAEVALTTAEAALTAAEVAVSTAEAALADARTGGDPDAIAAAEAELATATGARDDAAVTADDAAAALESIEASLLSLEIELGETELLVSTLEYLSYGRDFETEEQLTGYLADLEVGGFSEYAAILADLADACFAFPADDASDDEDGPGRGADDRSDDAPTAPVARPVKARATFTG